MPLPYCFRIDWKRRIPLSRFQIGADGSFPNTIEMEPFAAFWGTIAIRADAEETSLTKMCGFHPRRDTALNASRENLPNEKMIRTFALLTLRCVNSGIRSV